MLEMMWRKGNPPALFVGMLTDMAIMSKSINTPLKIAIKLPYDSAIPPLGIYSEKTIIEKDIYIP